MSTWLITGCSTGFGRDLALAALARGHEVVVTARDPDSLEDVVARFPDTALAARLDVTKSSEITEVISRAHYHFGDVDVLVNNAGQGYRSAIEEGVEADIRGLFETNVFGAMALTTAVLPSMRARRSGVVVNIGSLAGRHAAAGAGFYASTKYALEGFSYALLQELAPLGIRVIIVEPGVMRTHFTNSLRQSVAPIADYAATAGLSRKENTALVSRRTVDRVLAANVVIDAVENVNAPFRLPLGSEAVDVIRKELQKQLAELETCAELAASVDSPEAVRHIHPGL